MLGQSSPPDDKTSLPLRFETDQAALSQKVVLWRSTRFFWRGLGFAVLIVIGVSAYALHPAAAYGSSASSRLVPALAFIKKPPLSLRAIHEASHPVSGHARNAALSASALEEPLAAPFSVTKQPLEWQPVPEDAIISLWNEASARTAKPVQAKLMEEGSLQKNIYELRVPELKAALRERGLPVSGKKADLITRLETNMEESLHRVQEFTSHVQPLVDSSYIIKSNEGASLPTMRPHGVDILGYPQEQYFDDLASPQEHAWHQHQEQDFDEELVDSSSMERSESASLPSMQSDVGVQLQGLPQVQPQGVPQERQFDDLASAQEDARQNQWRFGDEYFNDLGTAKKRAQRILRHFAGESLPSVEFRIVYDILQRHPDCVIKRVADVVRISVERSENFPETQCFWIWHADGSGEDISLRKCLPMIGLEGRRGTR